MVAPTRTLLLRRRTLPGTSTLHQTEEASSTTGPALMLCVSVSVGVSVGVSVSVGVNVSVGMSVNMSVTV